MIKVLFSSESRFPIERERIRKKIEEVLSVQNVKGNIEVSFSIVGDRKIKDLNKNYLGIDKATDVLSFPLTENGKDINQTKTAGFVSYPDEILRLGDIVVSYPQALAQAVERNILVDEEIDFLAEHGLLHLLGIHHDDDK